VPRTNGQAEKNVQVLAVCSEQRLVAGKSMIMFEFSLCNSKTIDEYF